MKGILLCVLLAVALSQPVIYSDKDEAEWKSFKIKHEKIYREEKEEMLRKEIFMQNLNFIHTHNNEFKNGEVNFTVGVNKFSDLTNIEFRDRMNGFKIPEGYVRKGAQFEFDKKLRTPPSVDWRTVGAVTPVKNQASCGSCWAFSATGSLEGQTFLKTKSMTSLSEQNLMDCSGPYGNHGCNGGLMDRAFEYVKDNHGIDSETSYPYEARNNFCRYNPNNVAATCTGYVDIASGSEAELQQAVGTVGPVSVAIDASQASFQFYKSGVYTGPCSSRDLDHGVLAVGYGTAQQGGDYWIVKNSWGTTWGMEGYMLMARNHNNMCGIATMASYPIV